MQDSPGDVTLLLAEMKSGNSEALPKLIPLVYHELKRLAAYFLREEREGHTLQATALVNEAYLRLAGRLLAGFLNRDDGIVLYSLASRTFRRLTGHGADPVWLSDSRRILFLDGGKVHLLDSASGSTRERGAGLR
jgi:hypothetical protein